MRIVPEYGQRSLRWHLEEVEQPDEVLFPEPLGPIRPKISPRFTENDIFLRISFPPYSLPRDSALMTISLIFLSGPGSGRCITLPHTAFLDQVQAKIYQYCNTKEDYPKSNGKGKVALGRFKRDCSRQHPGA